MIEILEMKNIKDATPEEVKKLRLEKEQEKPEWQERMLDTFLKTY